MRFTPELLGAALVGTTFTGIDLDHVADFDKVSNAQLGAVFQFGRLHHLARSVAASGTFGVVNLTHDSSRQLYGQGDEACQTEKRYRAERC